MSSVCGNSMSRRWALIAAFGVVGHGALLSVLVGREPDALPVVAERPVMTVSLAPPWMPTPPPGPALPTPSIALDPVRGRRKTLHHTADGPGPGPGSAATTAGTTGPKPDDGSYGPRRRPRSCNRHWRLAPRRRFDGGFRTGRGHRVQHAAPPTGGVAQRSPRSGRSG